MQPGNELLKTIVKRNRLSVREAAILLGISEDTVKAYLSNPKSKRYRNVPEGNVDYLLRRIDSRNNIISSIHKQFDSIIDELNAFISREFHCTHDRATTISLNEVAVNRNITESDNNTSNVEKAKKLAFITEKINDLWIDYIDLDLDGNIDGIVQCMREKHLTD